MTQKKINQTHAIAYANILLYSLLYSASIKIFIIPHKIFTGGFSGIAMIIAQLSNNMFNIGALTLVFNIPLLIIAFFVLSKKFFFRTLIAVIFTSFLIDLIPTTINGQIITNNSLLSVLFGGVIVGFSSGKLLQYYASTGGIDIISTVFAYRGVNLGVGKIGMLINLLIFAAAFFMNGGEATLYSILLSFIVSFVIDSVQLQTNSVMITVYSRKSGLGDKIATINRGSTRIDALGGFTGDPVYIYQIVTDKLEAYEVRKIVKQHDPEAFFVYQNAEKVYGKFARRIV
ncbi:MAG: YitT family protein [Culicoidibacterales bacterium]